MTKTNLYKEKLRQRQQQEYADKGKTGLGRKSVLDFSRAAREINLWTPRYIPEANAIDILPFIITQDWYRKLRMPSGRLINLEIGDWDYKLQVPVHKSVGANNDTYLCLRESFGGPCIICDEMFDAYKEGDKNKARGLKPGWRCFYNIYDYDDLDKGIQLFEISYYNFEATSNNDPTRTNLIDSMMLDDKGPVVFYDLEEGNTLALKFKKKLFGKNDFPEILEIKFEDRDPYQKDILQQVYPLDSMLVIPKPEEVQKAHLDLEGMEGEEVPEGQASEQVQPEPSRTRTRSAPVAKTEETKAPEPASTSRRSRGESAPPAKEPEAPPWDKDGEWGQCPAKKAFGKNCNSGPECEGKGDNACDEATFAACSEAFTKMQNQPIAEKQPDPALTVKEEIPAAVSTLRRKRR